MTAPRAAAFHAEAKKHAVRQTADGWVVSFVVHPNDIRADFAVAPLGTRYMLALAQIGDDEQPVSPAGPFQPHNQERTTSSLSPAGRESADGQTRPAGERSRIAKEHYRNAPLMEQALIRAARLPKDPAFRQWCAVQIFGESGPVAVVSEDEAVKFIREKCCNGGSRRLISEDPECYDKFIALETEHKISVGELARPR